MDVKDIIRNKRLEKGLTMKELADQVGVSEATISRWESGEIDNMRQKGIVALAKALGVTPSVIMGWEDKSTKENHDADTEEYAWIARNAKKLNVEDQIKLKGVMESIFNHIREKEENGTENPDT